MVVKKHFSYDSKILFFFIILTFYACSSNENVLLELALDNSGENRSELEAVLDHYKDNQKKQEAARFLISNMIGKQVLDSNSVKGNHVYFDAFANYRETYGSFLYDIQYAIYDSINKLYSYTKVNPRFLSDLKELSSDYLIHHIDQCFQNKERYPWCKNMDWDIFFDYVLPYTTDNCHWEHAGSYFDRKYASLRDSMYMCSYEEIGKAISDEVEQGFLNEWIIFTGKYQGLRPMTFQNIVATQMGTCLEKSTYKIAALRANGIPAALNMVPCWGNSQYPHSWVEIIGSKQFGMIYDNTHGFLLGAFHAVGQAEAQLHDPALPGRKAVHGAAQTGALGVLLQLLAHHILVAAEDVRQQQLVAVAVHIQRLVKAGLLAAVGGLAQVHQDLVADAAAGVGGQLDAAFRREGVHGLDQPDGADADQVLGGHTAVLVLFGKVHHQPQIVQDERIAGVCLSGGHAGQQGFFLGGGEGRGQAGGAGQILHAAAKPQPRTQAVPELPQKLEHEQSSL